MEMKFRIIKITLLTAILAFTACGYEDIHKLNIRDTGPAGGKIFYINPNAGKDGWKYLEAAPESTEFTSIQWQNPEKLIGNEAMGTAIGTGKSNTAAIIAWLGNNDAKQKNRAAQLCGSLKTEHNGVVFNDWFLPSKDELNMIFLNLKSGKDKKNKEYSPVGGFADKGYWSSSETGKYGAWIQYFFYGNHGNYNKNTPLKVRAIRAF